MMQFKRKVTSMASSKDLIRSLLPIWKDTSRSTRRSSLKRFTIELKD